MLLVFFTIYLQLLTDNGQGAPTSVAPVSTTGTSLMKFSVHKASWSESKGTGTILITRRGGDLNINANVRLTITRKNVVASPSVSPFVKNVVFQGRVANVWVSFDIKDDKIFENNELFKVTLSHPSNGVIAAGLTSLTILDNDQNSTTTTTTSTTTPASTTTTMATSPASTITTTAPAQNTTMKFSVHKASWSESRGTGTILVTRRGGDLNINANVRLTITRKNVVASPSVTPFVKNVVFQGRVANVWVSFDIKDDKTVENNELFEVTLSHPSTGVIAAGLTSLTILDDDSTTPASTTTFSSSTTSSTTTPTSTNLASTTTDSPPTTAAPTTTTMETSASTTTSASTNATPSTVTSPSTTSVATTMTPSPTT